MASQLHKFSAPRRPGRQADGAAIFTLKALPLAVALCFSPLVHAQSINPATSGLPMGGAVASGGVSGQVSADNLKLTLTQTTSRAVIDWQSFNIDAGKTVQFIQPGATSAALNRVSASADMSQIYGSLQANGAVLLANPNGVMFHQGANINVGSLIVTTGTVNQASFDAGGAFGISNAVSGSVTNQGSITAGGAGLIALVAPSVVNQGTIIATAGRVALSGADRGTVSLNGGLYEFAVGSGATAAGAQVSNVAGARLEAGNILLTTGDAANLVSGVINLLGVQQASSAIVVNGNTVVLKSDLAAPSISGNSNTVQVQAGASIQDGVNIAKVGAVGAGATVNVEAGTYAEAVTVAKANLTLGGQTASRLNVADNTDGITIAANNVTVRGLELAGPVTASYLSYAWGSNVSRGIRVGDGITGFSIRDNNIHDVRNGILIHGRNSTGAVSGNTIDNTKSGISVQYTDASGITISGNREGTIGNEWGVNLHLNGHLDGTGAIVSNSPLIAAGPSASWQQSLLDMSAANNGWAVQDQGYGSSNRTQANVASAGSASNQGSSLTPLDTIQNGINAVVSGGRVNIAAGSYTQATTLTVGKSITLAGAGEGSTVIDARTINSGYGMSVTADNVTLRDFTFYGPQTFYASAYGIKVSPGGDANARLRNFTITHVTSRGAGKAELDLNGVDGALIDGVTLDGAPVGNSTGSTQGAGLQLTDSANVIVRNSTTRNNAWGGVALYQANRSYNQQVNNISLEGSNSYAESNPVFMQDESATRDFGTVSIAGFGYAVRNTGTSDSAQYTWLQKTAQNAYDYAVNLSGAAVSTVQAWDGSAATQTFKVGVGRLASGGTQAMSIATAVAQSNGGATIDVGPGSFNEALLLNGQRNLRLNGVTVQSLTVNTGAANTGIGGDVTASGITFNAATSLLSDTKLTASNGSIVFNGTLQGNANSLTLNATDSVSGTGTVRVPTLNVTAGKSVALALDVASAEVRAGVRTDLSGRAGEIGVDAPHGSLSGGFDKVRNTGKGVLIINGKSLQNEDVAPIIENIRVVPVIVLPPLPPLPPAPPPVPVTLHASVDVGLQTPTASGGPAVVPTAGGGSTGSASGGSSGTVTTSGNGGTTSGNGGSVSGGGSAGSTGSASPAGGRPAVVAVVSGPRQVPVTRSSAGRAGDSLDRGQGVEIDLSPGQ